MSLSLKNLRPPLQPRDTRPGLRRSKVLMPAGRSVRHMVFLMLEEPSSSRLAKIYSVLMMLAICASTTCFVLETIPEMRFTPEACLSSPTLTVENCFPRPLPIFHDIEKVTVGLFTIDYVLRIATVHVATPKEAGVSNLKKWTGMGITMAYARQVLNLIDVFAILPFYAEALGLGGGGAAGLRVLRLVRIFRVLKMKKLRSCAEMFIEVLLDACPALLIMLFVSILACVFFSSCIFIAEGTWYSVDEEFISPELPFGLYVRPTKDGFGLEPTPFRSVDYSFWWFFTTATTVGFGDDFPTTLMGRIVAICVFCAGIILLAMPITIVGGSFSKYYDGWLKQFCKELKQAESDSGSPTAESDWENPELDGGLMVSPHTETSNTSASDKLKNAWG